MNGGQISWWNPMTWGNSGLPASQGPNSLTDPGAMSVPQLREVLPGAPGGVGGSGFGLNIPTAQLGMSALGSIANFWNGMQAQDLAKKQFNLVERTTNTNLANQIRSYNTALSDRARSRGVAEGQSPDQVAAYVRDNQMTR